MSFFMALTTALLWLRFLFMLELVPKVGTLIKISIKLLGDILTFAFLFLMTLLAFSSAGMISFVELQEYRTVLRSIKLLFFSIFGYWD